MVFFRSACSINSTDRDSSIQVGEYLFNDYQVFNAVNHFDGSATGAADFDVDIDYPLEV